MRVRRDVRLGPVLTPSSPAGSVLGHAFRPKAGWVPKALLVFLQLFQSLGNTSTTASAVFVVNAYMVPSVTQAFGKRKSPQWW